MKNYIITSYKGPRLVLTPASAEALNKYRPRGCPFENYTMLDLLKDFAKMDSWILEKNKKYNILDFLDLITDIKARVYRAGFEELITE